MKRGRIRIFSGGTPEDAYAQASWVEKDKALVEKQASSVFGKAFTSSSAPPVPATVGEGEGGDEETKDSNPAIVDARGSPAKPNGWKLAKRAGTLGFVDEGTQWAKNKVTRPFIVPPTEEEINFSDEEGNADDA